MDEAERCHQLAILNLGRVVAAGSPRELQDRLAMDVVEIETNQVNEARALLATLPSVRSVAQLGVRLRVMIEPHGADSVRSVRAALEAHAIVAQAAAVQPSLEDVFVGATAGQVRS
jgi:ABC-2 type transport system ATP-binding protein